MKLHKSIFLSLLMLSTVSAFASKSGDEVNQIRGMQWEIDSAWWKLQRNRAYYGIGGFVAGVIVAKLHGMGK
jgi:hypothetical protein